MKVQWDSEGIIENINVRNNIVSDNHHFSFAVWPRGAAPTGMNIDHNLIDGYRNGTGYGETYCNSPVKSKPSFADASNEDFHLSASSAAIDKASSDNAPTLDFDGTLRPHDSGYDIGAFEYEN